jgi:nucleotide-binding universal stress UspA family protein
MAKEDFHRQRRLAAYQLILARLAGREPGLLSFEEVSQKLHISGGYDRGEIEIPVDAIVGSVSRHAEFTRSFMPVTSQNIERWSRVKMAVDTGVGPGLPPIEVYQIGDVYFVIDGHNRVSVAREIGAKFILARVTEIRTRASLDGGITPEALILAAEKADFLEATQFDTLLPEADLNLTIPGYYSMLIEHIEVHRYFMGLELKRDVSSDEAVRDWYQEVYIPVKTAIRETGILEDFPGRSEGDLYIWVSEHRYLLEKDLGWIISPDKAARSLASRASPRLWRVIQRWMRKISQRLTPPQLRRSPSAGEWRRDLQMTGECLFTQLLVPISSVEASRPAIDQALAMPRCEGSNIQGLLVTTDATGAESESTQVNRSEFDQSLAHSGAQGSLAVVNGEIAGQIVEHAALSDLVILNVAHPTGPSMADRFSSGLRTIVLRCPKPVLAVPGKISPLSRLILAYDGSPRAREALFVATFLAGKRNAPLVVVSVSDNRKTANNLLDEASRYLNDREVDATFLSRQGDPGTQILETASSTASNLILMGGYGTGSLAEMVLGSTVDHILRSTNIPVLICK